METYLLEKWSQFRPFLFFPFQLWLWAVSIPIRFFLYLTVGEFWKWSDLAKTRSATNGASFFSAIPSANLSSKKSETTQRGALLKTDQSVFSDPGRNVLKGAWMNDYTTRSTTIKRVVEPALTKADADIMQAKPSRKIEVDFSKAKSKATPSAPSSASKRSVDSENRIGSFITVEKDMHDAFTRKEEKIPSFVSLDSDFAKEPRRNAFVKHEEAIPSFITLDETPVAESKEVKAETRVHGFFNIDAEPIKPAASKSSERIHGFFNVDETPVGSIKIVDRRSAPAEVSSEKPKKMAKVEKKSDDSESNKKFAELSKQKEELEAKLAQFTKTSGNKDALLEMNIRKNYDLEQELVKTRALLREHDMEKARLQNDFSDLQRNFTDLSNKQTQASAKKSEKSKKKAAKAAKAPEPTAWAHADISKGYTEMLRQEQEHLPAKSFAETVKEAVNVPIEKSKTEEFTVVGGAESMQHITAPVSAI